MAALQPIALSPQNEQIALSPRFDHMRRKVGRSSWSPEASMATQYLSLPEGRKTLPRRAPRWREQLRRPLNKCRVGRVARCVASEHYTCDKAIQFKVESAVGSLRSEIRLASRARNTTSPFGSRLFGKRDLEVIGLFGERANHIPCRMVEMP
jgi:hypothetical protein